MFNTIVVLLNGPPGIGKDTLADALVKCHEKYSNALFKMEYKAGLRRATAQVYHCDQGRADYLFAHRKLKEIPCKEFENRSPRGALIATDTNLKKTFGRSMVGEWAATAVQDAIQLEGKKHFIFSDSGFLPEAEVVAEKVDFLMVVNLLHPDFNFDGDSRDYIKMDGVNSCTIQFHRCDDAIEQDAEALNDLISDTLWENRNK